MSYYDKRQEFFRTFFTQGERYAEYLNGSSPAYQERWREYEKRVSLTPEQSVTVQGFKRKMNVLVLSGAWCGDCARQGPMVRAIAEAASAIDLRFLDNRQNPELQGELRINGAEKVPVVVVLSEDFYELSRFGDRHLSVYRRKAAQETGAVCDPGIVPAPEDELRLELEEWVHHFERLQLILLLSPLLRRRYGD